MFCGLVRTDDVEVKAEKKKTGKEMTLQNLPDQDGLHKHWIDRNRNT